MIMVASYCRVSTDKDDQVNSFAKAVAQQARDYIKFNESPCKETTSDIEFSLKELEQKKKEVLDAFFSKLISKEDVRLMNEQYDAEILKQKEKLETLREMDSLEYNLTDLADDILTHINMIAQSTPDDELFLKSFLNKVVVYEERRVELKLNLMPPSWSYVLVKLEELKRLKMEEKKGVVSTPMYPPISTEILNIRQAKKH